MEKKKKTILESLKEYFQNNTQEQIDADWESVNDVGIGENSMTVDRFIELHENQNNLHSVLTNKQIESALYYYANHRNHVLNLINEAENKRVSPSENEDKNNPALWKPIHWNWFFDKI